MLNTFINLQDYFASFDAFPKLMTVEELQKLTDTIIKESDTKADSTKVMIP